MNDTSDSAEATPEMAARARKATDLTDRAVEAYESRKRTRCLSLAREAIATGALTLIDGARLVELLRALDEIAEAEALAAATLARVDDVVALAGDNAELLFESGHACMELNAADKAQPLLIRASELKPEDGRAAILLIRILLEKGEPDRLLRVWEGFLKHTGTPGMYLLLLAKAFGQFGFRDHAETVLETAEPLYRKNPDPFLEARAAVRGEENPLSQRDSAAKLFDRFAERYDENLKAIGNKGPDAIAAMLSRIGLTPDRSRIILDAGCGTGLCAPFLRPYAAEVHGCDVSVKMLEICKGKRLYDLLTRTDLGMRPTIPDGPFDVIVSGDVFVYFGDLLPAFRNLAAVLKPGGWFIFTVENCTTSEEPPKGYELKASGRYAHGPDYLSRVLVQAGFGRPAKEFTTELRQEFKVPIMGRAVAAQKLALFG